ncbi:LysR family transcriptional regulator [Streptomyces bathyalis]|uniref:LysR family transcriptional regulator n=1 Tax=Streptomyces bathyalis TaxID=2710756 RepID=A0A7T1T3G8_9ACTN|nr:LysR family transcriptional regulator [Streptomyces bathyalis]QPP05689.1 LysR family transcriptional regulator [Streptomyces bathyalis]
MDLEVRHLRVIRAVADAGSLTRAAAVLGLSQPSLTAQLQRIERMLGGPLFVRHRGGASPTALGELVVAKARELLPQLDSVQQEVLSHLGFSDGRLSLRYVANPGPLMVRLLGPLRSLFPGAEAKLRTEPDVATVLDLVAARQQDLGALVEYEGSARPPRREVEQRVVAIEPAFVLLPEEHPMAGRPMLGLGELAEDVWVLPPSQGSGLHDAFAAACTGAGFTAVVQHEAEAAAARELIVAGAAIGLGQATFRSTPGIVPRPLKGTPLRLRHSLVWHRESALAAHGAALVEHAEKAYADAIGNNPQYPAWLTDHGQQGPAHREPR